MCVVCWRGDGGGQGARMLKMKGRRYVLWRSGKGDGDNGEGRAV